MARVYHDSPCLLIYTYAGIVSNVAQVESTEDAEAIMRRHYKLPVSAHDDEVHEAAAYTENDCTIWRTDEIDGMGAKGHGLN